MIETDHAREEQYLFLPEAADAMAEYKHQHQNYASEWWMLNMTFANGPYNTKDPEVHPNPDLGNRWKPPGCEYTYQIIKADNKEFIIRAFNSNGLPRFEIRNGLNEPERIK